MDPNKKPWESVRMWAVIVASAMVTTLAMYDKIDDLNATHIITLVGLFIAGRTVTDYVNKRTKALE